MCAEDQIESLLSGAVCMQSQHCHSLSWSPQAPPKVVINADRGRNEKMENQDYDRRFNID